MLVFSGIILYMPENLTRDILVGNDTSVRIELGDVNESTLKEFLAQLDQEVEWENLKYDM